MIIPDKPGPNDYRSFAGDVRQAIMTGGPLLNTLRSASKLEHHQTIVELWQNQAASPRSNVSRHLL